MSRILVTRAFPGPGIASLNDHGFEVDLFDRDEIIPRKELLQRVKGVDALLSLLTDKIDAEVMDAAGPSLKIIANYAVGFDNVDLDAAKKRNIIVTNTPVSEMSESVAEFTMALMFAVARRVCEADVFTREKKYTGWSPNLFLGMDLRGKTLGVIGAGRIGTRVAEMARLGLGMSIVYTSRKPDPDLSTRLSAPFLPLDQVLERADVVTLHVPLLPDTKHLISTEQFSLMKKDAILLNTSRGPIVDEKALLRALRTGRIAGAGIDVYEAEPAIDTDPSDKLELRAMPNVVMTPHIASATIQTREAMGRLAVANIVAVLTGEKPLSAAG
ncbi:D-glycerate dehydrogenase [Patescibacteria group bacterium]|nr:D-glycerate dehydrogenase [Patescibacteria group bacterium]